MKRYVKVGTALLSCLTIMGSQVPVLAEELTPEQQYINESLAELGVNSPFYDNSYLKMSENGNTHNDLELSWSKKAVDDFVEVEQIDLSQYSEISDPYWKFCLLNNYKNTAFAEAQASTGVVNCLQTHLEWGVKLDASNIMMGSGSYEACGITKEEVDALPLYPLTDSWKPVNLVMTDEFYQYTEKVSDLVWAHSGCYFGRRREVGEPLAFMEENYVSLGLNASAYESDVYTGSAWTNAVTKCRITMKYSYATEEYINRGWEPFELIALPGNTDWSSQQWRLILYGVPNEMDWKIIHSILNAITPDAEVIYQALRTEWSDPLGYGPWKYWDKWYDIGEQSRIRTWRRLIAEETSELAMSIQNGPQLTRYYYDIAPRDNGTTVNMSALDLIKEQRYGAKFY